MSLDPKRIENARRRIAADIMDLGLLKLRFRVLIRSLEDGYAELADALGTTILPSIGEPEPEVA